jgi:hypothetical protein
VFEYVTNNSYIHFINLTKGKFKMLETIALILLVLWVLGLVTSTTIGGFIHILLVIAIVMILLRIIRGRRL